MITLDDVLEALKAKGLGAVDFMTGDTVVETAQLSEDINGDGGLTLSWRSDKGGVIPACDTLLGYVMDEPYVPTLNDDGTYQWSPKWSEPCCLLNKRYYRKDMKMTRSDSDSNVLRGTVLYIVEDDDHLPVSAANGAKAIVTKASSGKRSAAVIRVYTNGVWSDSGPTSPEGSVYRYDHSDGAKLYKLSGSTWTEVDRVTEENVPVYSFAHTNTVGEIFIVLRDYLKACLGSEWDAQLHDDNSQSLGNTGVLCTFDGTTIKGAFEELANKAADAYRGNGFVNLYYVGKTVHLGLSTAYSAESYYNRFIILGGLKNMAKRNPEGTAYAAITQRLSLEAGDYVLLDDGTVEAAADDHGTKVVKKTFQVEQGSVIDMRPQESREPTKEVDGQRVASEKYMAVMERFLVWDDIYPQLTLFIDSATPRYCYLLDDNGEKIEDGIVNGRTNYKMYCKWYVTLRKEDGKPYKLDTRYIIQDKPLSLLFQSGTLMGREFEVVYFSEQKTEHDTDDVSEHGHTAEEGELRIIMSAEGDIILPTLPAEDGGGLCPKSGDWVSLVNVAIEDEVKDAARMKLLERGYAMAKLISSGKVASWNETRVLPDAITGDEVYSPVLGEEIAQEEGGYIVTSIERNLVTGETQYSWGTFKPRGILASQIDKIGSLSLSGGEATFKPLVSSTTKTGESGGQIVYVGGDTETGKKDTVTHLSSSELEKLLQTEVKVQKGSTPPSTGSTATVYLYKRSENEVTSTGLSEGNYPDLYYKFSEKKLYTDRDCTKEFKGKGTADGDIVYNGWEPSIPTGNGAVYITSAIAYSETGVDDIGKTEWVTPLRYDGKNGINAAAVFLYQRKDEAPTQKPPGGLLYKFADGKLYKKNDNSATSKNERNGWEYQIPSGNDACYVVQAAALSSDAYDEIRADEWSDIRKLVEDGQSAPYYEDYWYAWSNKESTNGLNNSPFDNETSQNFEDFWTAGSVPPNTDSLLYLWRRSQKMVFDKSENKHVKSGAPTYVRMTGTDGTSIKTKGTVAVVAVWNDNTPPSLPTENMSDGDLGIKQGDPKIYVYNSEAVNKWAESGSTASDGDGYVVSKSCVVDLEGSGSRDLKGHFIMWSAEAHTHNDKKGWIDLGEFKGQDGTTYYTHIAWASYVELLTDGDADPKIPQGQKSVPNAKYIDGFSIVPNGNIELPWMGILINTDSRTDIGSGTSEAARNEQKLYTWNHTQGVQGEDGKSREWIYKFGTGDETVPGSTIDNIDYSDPTTVIDICDSDADLPSTAEIGDLCIGGDLVYEYKSDDLGWESDGNPIRTGDVFVNAKDGHYYIYAGKWIDLGTETPAQYDGTLVDDFVPYGWSDNALSISPSNPCVVACYRDYIRTAKRWSEFKGYNGKAIIWSRWGNKGTDGDGVQYVYKLFDHELKEDASIGGQTVNELIANVPDKSAAEASYNENGEWIPRADEGKNAGWHDDPPSPTPLMPWCYCSTIKRINEIWGSFSKLSYWTRWTYDGGYVDLDNPYEEMLYNGETRVSDKATSNCRLIVGGATVTSGVKWYIESFTGVSGASININTGILEVTGMTANTGTVLVKAVYGGKSYYGVFKCVKADGGKYDLILTPDTVVYDGTDSWEGQKIVPSVKYTNKYGAQSDVTIRKKALNVNPLPVAGEIYLMYGFVTGNETGVSTQLTTDGDDLSLNVTAQQAATSRGVQFELYRYVDGTHDHLCDYDTVPITKGTSSIDREVFAALATELWKHRETLGDAKWEAATLFLNNARDKYDDGNIETGVNYYEYEAEGGGMRYNGGIISDSGDFSSNDLKTAIESVKAVVGGTAYFDVSVNTYPDSPSKYAMRIDGITATAPDNKTYTGGIRAFVYDGRAWELILTSTTALIENDGKTLRLLVYGAETPTEWITASGMLTTSNYVKMFATAQIDGVIMAEALFGMGILYHVYDDTQRDWRDVYYDSDNNTWYYTGTNPLEQYRDNVDDIVPYSFSKMSADNIEFTGKIIKLTSNYGTVFTDIQENPILTIHGGGGVEMDRLTVKQIASIGSVLSLSNAQLKLQKEGGITDMTIRPLSSVNDKLEIGDKVLRLGISEFTESGQRASKGFLELYSRHNNNSAVKGSITMDFDTRNSKRYSELIINDGTSNAIELKANDAAGGTEDPNQIAVKGRYAIIDYSNNSNTYIRGIGTPSSPIEFKVQSNDQNQTTKVVTVIGGIITGIT